MKGKHWIINYITTKELKNIVPRYIHGRLIDIGCGEKPLEPYFKQYVTEHIGVDHAETMHDKNNIDIFATAYEIPVEDASFDCALCTAVLEHLEEPSQAIAECHRVLKKGGVALYTVPFVWNLHEEPRDFYRYTKYGLTYLFEKNGFKIIELIALSGFWITFAQAVTQYLWTLRRKKKLKIFKPFFIIIPAFVVSFQALAYLLDKLDKREEWTWAYVVVVKK